MKNEAPRTKHQERSTKNEEPGTKKFLHSSFFILQFCMRWGHGLPDKIGANFTLATA